MVDITPITFALEFPQGTIFFMEEKGHAKYNTLHLGRVYFKPAGGNDAFIVPGERRELFGKCAITIRDNTKTGEAGYSIVWEFAADGALADARLVNKNRTVRGGLAAAAAVAQLDADIAAGALALREKENADEVFNVARFPDGRLLIQLSNKNELYLGTPGHYTRLDASPVASLGNYRIYETAEGTVIRLPHYLRVSPSLGQATGPKDEPSFGGQKLEYLDVEPGADPKAFGLVLKKAEHLNPFSPLIPGNFGGRISPQLKKGPTP